MGHPVHGSHSEGGDAPSTTAIAPVSADAVYVVNGGDDSISVIDAGANRVSATITVRDGTFPHHVYMSADRYMLLVALPGMDLSGGHHVEAEGMRGAVLLLEAATGRTLAAARLEAMNHNAIFSPDGREVWTSQMTMPGSVLVLDVGTLQTRHRIAVDDMPAEVTFSPDGRYAFVANSMSESVTVIEAATKRIVRTIDVGKGPIGAWPGRDGVMYVDNEQGRSISAIDSRSLAVVRTYDLGFTPAVVATGPAGELWVANSDDGNVVFFATATCQKLGELATGAGAHGVAFSADGETAYVTNQGAGTVSVIDAASRTVKCTITVGKKPNGVLFRSAR